MSEQSIEETAIHVFNEGEAVRLGGHSPTSLTYVEKTIPFDAQATEILAIVNSLAKTVNNNAYCLKNLLHANRSKPEPVRADTFLNYMEKTNQLLQTKSSLTSLPDPQAAPAPATPAKPLSLQSKIEAEIVRNSALIASLLKHIDAAKDDSAQKEAKIAGLATKLDTLESKFLPFKNEAEERLRVLSANIDSKLALIFESEKQIKEKLHAMTGVVNDTENRVKTEMKFLSQKLEDASKVIRSHTDLNKSPSGSKAELFTRYLEVSEFRKFQELQKELIDNLDERLSRINIHDLISELDRKQSELSSMQQQQQLALRSIETKGTPVQGQGSSGTIPTPTADAQFRQFPDSRNNRMSITQQADFLKEIDQKISDIERNLNKKIIGMDSRLKEIEDVKKLAKLMTRIQMELNLKINKEIFDSEIETKLGRNEFFDFVNKNLISVDRIRTVENQMTALMCKVESKFESVEKRIKKCQFELKALGVSSEDSAAKASDRMKENEMMLSKNTGVLGDLAAKVAVLAKDFEETRKEIFELVTARIRSLATTRPVLCLSCGARDINYPPLEITGEGITGGMYKLDAATVDENNNPNLDPMDKKGSKAFVISKPRIQTGKPSVTKIGCNHTAKASDEASTRLLDDIRGVSKMSASYKIPENKRVLLSGQSTNYVTGQQVFNRNVITTEHNQQRHDPVSQLIELDAIKAEKARPFSSIPQRSKIKGFGCQAERL